MVDDEPRILDAMRRSLYGRYTIVTATSGAQGLTLIAAAIDDGDPFPVVVSDMMMPGMTGAEFLIRARHLNGDAVQMILSGQADLTSTISAVNEGSLFRFLTKPCENADLIRALDDALRQHQLVLAERDLIENTLDGAVSVLTELLGLASPVAFGRTERVRALVERVSSSIPVADAWELRLASMLGQIGCVAVPTEVLRRSEAHGELTEEQTQMFRGHPLLARDLLTRIPRLERVAEWVGAQPLEIDDVAPSRNGVYAHDHPPGGPVPQETLGDGPVSGQLVFTAVTAFLAGCETGITPGAVARRLAGTGAFPQRLLDAVLEASHALARAGDPREVTTAELRPGMVLCQDVQTVTGMKLVGNGEQASATLIARLQNFAGTVGIVEPILVLA